MHYERATPTGIKKLRNIGSISFLLMAARRPSEHRSMIALAAWWNISHGVVMAIQTVEARIHSVPRNFTDVIVFLVIGVVLLALLPAKPEVVAPEVA
jgi:hypothetical protein